ncbi:MAG: GNAT family N-acetyltransferase [Lachnospiraceae bacterium]|nr:GNAT family N-acetyltransferase [Lachnospiraceae bacterium]
MRLSDIEYLGVDRVLRRGSGEILEEREDAVLVRDSISGAFLLACENREAGRTLLEKHLDDGCRLLMVPDCELGESAFRQYGFAEKLECWQLAWYGAPPALDSRIRVRTARPEDLDLLIRTYHLVSPEEMAQIVERKTLLLGYRQDCLVGFIGEHLEGSLGLLYIFPEFRRRGYAAALEKEAVARTLQKGYIPFGQVEKSNTASLLLQEKLGMVRSERLICWMWR